MEELRHCKTCMSVGKVVEIIAYANQIVRKS